MRIILRLLYFIFIMNVTGLHAQAPQWEWAHSLGSIHFDHGRTVELTPGGDVILGGTFRGAIDLDPGPDTVQLNGPGSSYATFIAKFDSAGVLKWAKKSGGNYLNSIAVDNDGSIYLGGTFLGSWDFDPDPVNTYIMTSQLTDGYIMKLDSAGEFLWAHKFGGLQDQIVNHVEIDPFGSGMIYVTGSYMNTVDFDPDTMAINNMTSDGEEDAFIASFDASGNFNWARSVGGNGSDIGNSITIDAAGDLFIAGIFEGMANLYPDSINNFYITSNGLKDAFILKLNTSGNPFWAGIVGGPGNDEIRGIAASPFMSDHIYFTGMFEQQADLHPRNATYMISAFAGYDCFLGSIDSSGNLLWGHKFGGNLSEFSNKIVAGPLSSNSIYITGSYEGGIDMDPVTGSSWILSSGATISVNPFVARFSFAGALEWATDAGGGTMDQGFDLAVDHNDRVYVTGTFSSHFMDFGSHTIVNTDASQQATDIYFAKLNPDFHVSQNDLQNSPFSIFPNPASDTFEFLVPDGFENAAISIRDVHGRNYFEKSFATPGNYQVNVSGLNNGVYLIYLYHSSGSAVSKLIKTGW